ncbi:MAG: hypothetical protein JWQ42_5148 [Edaphobacter sp.]|nr:hypothetical protein [Edaphobacter sp.]
MAQLPTASAGEKEFGFVLPLFAYPGPENLYRRPSERSAALLSPFTFAADVGTATQVDFTLSESNEFRNPKPGLNGGWLNAIAFHRTHLKLTFLLRAELPG